MQNNDATKIQPIILDLGKQTKKRIKQLKRGEGKLLEKLTTTVARAKNGAENGAELVPVVIVFDYEKKKAKKRSIPMISPFPFV